MTDAMRDALTWALAELRGETRYANEDQRQACFAQADAALARPAAPTQSAAQTGEVLWSMHVRGPDDVWAAPDYDTALEWADMVNYELAPRFPDILLRATPMLWPWGAERHAESLPRSVEEWTRPALSQPEAGR